MIKATDLMVGDWVQIVPDAPVMPNEYHRIDWIRTGEIGLDNRRIVTYPYIQPIPLTPEILEKKGWVKFHTYYRHSIDGSQYLEWYPHEGRLLRLSIHKDYGRVVEFTVSGLSYVHQFQHALKLCGIDLQIHL